MSFELLLYYAVLPGVSTDGNDNSTIVSHWNSFNSAPPTANPVLCPFGWQLALSTNNNNVNLYLGCPNNSSVTITGSSNVKDGNWHCASFVRHDRDYQLYVDGQLEGSGSQSTNLSYSGHNQYHPSCCRWQLHLQRIKQGCLYNHTITSRLLLPAGLPFISLSRL